MSHIVEEYAKNLGCHIGKPIVQRHFFPIDCQKYITISGDNKIPAKTYPYYFMTVRLLKEALAQTDVKIIQLGGSDKLIQGADKVLDSLTFKQYAHIISNSLLHIGPDNLFMHYASSVGVPLVTVYGNVYASISSGYWSKPNVKRDIEAPWSNKPSLNLNDPENSIAKIKPEEIARYSLELLGIKNKLKFKTLNIGRDFLNQVVEVIPQMYVPLPLFDKKMLLLRTDLGGTSDALLSYCFNHKVSLILDRAVIPVETIGKFHRNLAKIMVFIDAEMEVIPSEYLEAIKQMGVQVQMLVKNKDHLSDLRVKYFDYDVHLYTPPTQRPEHISLDAKFFSNKMVVEGENVYPSKAHWQVYEKCLDKPANIIDNPLYWEDIEHFYIYEH